MQICLTSIIGGSSGGSTEGTAKSGGMVITAAESAGRSSLSCWAIC